MDEQQKYKIARRRVEAKIGFYIHAGVFLLVNALLIAINMTKTPGELWFIYPLAGWGIGLLLHFVLVFSEVSSGDWKKRLIEKEVERLK